MEKGFYERVVKFIKTVPAGKVATYGQIADYAGNPRAAREVAYILHSSSEKENLPWQRVINSKGRISMKPGRGYELQKRLLEDEGVVFDEEGRIDFDKFLWQP
ncbi:DNA methyltransferase [candidate division WOR_3 bacterium SM23_60]|uniref:DNA methyltransferase n=1 Tax=candidate division WOR_3 bacterium SM23_60 TaxID=1703780 RepID=A0A0S8GLP9_UNCW3|nr:MAG: DNA methyltransferase [candidate division WOR_3 bacterium SM23_60]